jgi:hypothetical protein
MRVRDVTNLALQQRPQAPPPGLTFADDGGLVWRPVSRATQERATKKK